MAKKTRHSNSTVVSTEKGQGLQVHQTDHFDDTPLPDAEELAKYQSIDPSIVSWLMKMTEAEQKHRHGFDSIRAIEIKSINTRIFTVEMTRIFCAFLVIIAGFVFSYLLIVAEQPITGTVFAGGTIIAAVAMFLNIRKNPPEHKK